MRRNNQLFMLVSILLVICWILFILMMSTQSHKQQTIQPMLHSVSKIENVQDIGRSSVKHLFRSNDDPYQIIEHIFRKCAHLFVYGVLAVTTFSTLINQVRSNKIGIVISLGVVTVVGMVDEYIQSFSVNRTSTPKDVLIDLIGACVGLIIVVGIKRRKTE